MGQEQGAPLVESPGPAGPGDDRNPARLNRDPAEDLPPHHNARATREPFYFGLPLIGFASPIFESGQ